MFSQNSELDCVDSFCIRKVDLLFCKIISKSRNPRIWCNFQFAKMNCIKVDLLFCEIISRPRNPKIWCNFQVAKMNCNIKNIGYFNKVPLWPPRSFDAVWINLTIFLYYTGRVCPLSFRAFKSIFLLCINLRKH